MRYHNHYADRSTLVAISQIIPIALNILTIVSNAMRAILVLTGLLTLANAIPFPSGLDSTSLKDLRDLNFFKRDDDDPCSFLFKDPTGTSRYDCKKKNILDADGHCPVSKGDGLARNCASYCEIRRRAFLGEEVILPSVESQSNKFQPGAETTYQSGIEYSIQHQVGFSLGAGTLDGIISAGVSYAYSVGVTTAKSVALKEPPSAEHYSGWVSFPVMVETCGTLTEVDTMRTSQTGRTGSVINSCGGTPRDTPNVCSRTPFMGRDGKPVMMYALSTF